MHDFILREIKDTDIEKEINAIGFDKSYSHKAKEKFEYKNIKIYSLTPAMANILKQTALSVGCDCATHREVITGKIENSNCILGGSVSQIKKIAEKLKFQPFGLKELGKKLENSCPSLAGGPKSMISRRRTKLVGILNLTTNSFSDGGMYNDFEKAKEHLLELISDGADIIDIGAESTKPYSSPVSPKEQLEKLLPIIDFAKNKTTISIDTRSAIVAEECINAGANIINDVSGFDYDEKMVDVIAKHNIPIIIQHLVARPNFYFNKNVKIRAKFDKFATLGLDYKPAFRSSEKYISFLIQRPDVTDHNIPLSELKIFLNRTEAEKHIDLNSGDIVEFQGRVFSTALGDPWMDVDKFTVISTKPKDETK